MSPGRTSFAVRNSKKPSLVSGTVKLQCGRNWTISGRRFFFQPLVKKRRRWDRKWFSYAKSEMRYCEISKEMSSLYFGLAVFCLFEPRVPEFYTQPLPPSSCGLKSVHCPCRFRYRLPAVLLLSRCAGDSGPPPHLLKMPASPRQAAENRVKKLTFIYCIGIISAMGWMVQRPVENSPC
jgi:hypothetical protein